MKKVGPKALVLKFLFLGELRFGRKRHVVYFYFLIYLLILFALLFQDSLACPKDMHANKASFYPQNHRATRTDHRLDTADTLPNLLQVDILWKLQAEGVTLPPFRYTRNIWTKLPPHFLSRDGPNDFGRAENPG